jgi:cytochrome c biogenesis protein CcmG, thiol:disulfide interchange protein DsbE
MKQLILSILCALSITAFAQKALPNVDIKTLEGKTINSQKLGQNGKVTIVSFWATWCSPCKKELDEVTKKYAQWQKDYNIELVAISIDNAQGLPKIKPMVAQKGWKFTVLSDVNSELLNGLGGQTVPYTIVLNKKGKIVYEHNGYIAGDEIALEKKVAEFSK